MRTLQGTGQIADRYVFLRLVEKNAPQVLEALHREVFLANAATIGACAAVPAVRLLTHPRAAWLAKDLRRWAKKRSLADDRRGHWVLVAAVETLQAWALAPPKSRATWAAGFGYEGELAAGAAFTEHREHLPRKKRAMGGARALLRNIPDLEMAAFIGWQIAGESADQVAKRFGVAEKFSKRRGGRDRDAGDAIRDQRGVRRQMMKIGDQLDLPVRRVSLGRRPKPAVQS